MKVKLFFIIFLNIFLMLVVLPSVNSSDYKYFSLPKGAKMRMGKGSISDIKYSPDGLHLAVASSIGIWIYDTKNGKELNLFPDDKHDVKSIEYTPDGKYIACVCSDGKVRMWNATTGKQNTTLNMDTDGKYQDIVVEFSSDGKTVATGGYYLQAESRTKFGVLRLWDTATGKLRARIISNKRMVNSIVFSPDNTTLIGKSNRSATAQLIDVNSGKLIATLVHKHNIFSLIYSPDSSALATLSIDKEVYLWDTETGNLEKTLEHKDQITSITYSPDSAIIATASIDQTVKFWDVASGKLKTTSIEYTDWITEILYSPNGKTFACASTDKTLSLWDSSSRELKSTLNHSSQVLSFMYSNEGTIIVSRCSDSTIYLWDTSTARQIASFKHADDIVSFMYSSVSSTLTSWTKDNAVRLWDANTGNLIRLIDEHIDAIFCLAYSPDNKTIATGTSDKKVILWDVANGDLKTTLTGHTNRIHSLYYSPNGTTLASWGYDYLLILWDTASGDRKVIIKPNGWVNSVAFSPDGTTITAACGDKTLRSWDTSTGKLKNSLLGHKGQVGSIAYTADGTIIVSGSSHDKTVRLWHATSGLPKRVFQLLDQISIFVYSPIDITVALKYEDNKVDLWDVLARERKVTLEGQQDYFIYHFTYSPDATTVACLNSNAEKLNVWNASNGSLIASLSTGKTQGRESTHSGHTRWEFPYVYSPDSTTIAGGYNNSIRLWDVNSGTIKATLKHSDWVYGFAFSSDGTLIAIGCKDGTVLLWDVNQISKD